MHMSEKPTFIEGLLSGVIIGIAFMLGMILILI